MSHHKIEIKDLQYIYPDGNRAVNGMSFLITHGESVGIIGANGAGKSTLLLLLMGVLTPTGGEVVIGDVKVSKKTLPIIRRHLGLIFQDPDDQLFMTSVYDDVAFGPRNYKLDENEVGKRVGEALKMVGIPHLKERAPFKLSGGEKRAVSIAGVLSMQPDALVLDEPANGLDPKARRKVINILKGFKHTKIIAGHDIDMIFELCERTILIKGGEIKKDGKTKDIITDKRLMEECGLEVPLSLQNCPVCGYEKTYE